jgi:hypothetical protein
MVRSAPLTTPTVDSTTGTLYAFAIRATETMLREQLVVDRRDRASGSAGS